MKQFLAENEDPGLAVRLFDLVKTLQRCWNAPRTGRSTRSAKKTSAFRHGPHLQAVFGEAQGQALFIRRGDGKAAHPPRHDLPVPGHAGNGASQASC